MRSHIVTGIRRQHNLGYAPPAFIRGHRVLRRLGDATQDGLDLTMQDRAQTLIASFNGGSVTSAPNGAVVNFQTAWNNSTPGQNFRLATDGEYGSQTAQALAQALQFVPNGGQAIGGNAPAPFNYGGGGGGGTVTTPTVVIPGSTTPSSQSVTVTTPSSSKSALIVGGALVLAAGIAGWAYYEKGGGKQMLARRRAAAHGHHQRRHA